MSSVDLFPIFLMFSAAYTGPVFPCGPRETLEGHTYLSGLFKYIIAWSMIFNSKNNPDVPIKTVFKNTTFLLLGYILFTKQSDTMFMFTFTFAATQYFLWSIYDRDSEYKNLIERLYQLSQVLTNISLILGFIAYINQRKHHNREFSLVQSLLPTKSCETEVDMLALGESISLGRLMAPANFQDA